MNHAGGPVGAPGMILPQDASQLAQFHPNGNQAALNTYIYDYLLRKESWETAKHFLANHKVNTIKDDKNDPKKSKRPFELPEPYLPVLSGGEGVLETWWSCFWDMMLLGRNPDKPQNEVHKAYLIQQKTRANATNPFNSQPQFNGVNANGMAAKNMGNRNITPQAMAVMQGQMQNKMLGQQNPAMDMNGQRPQTPGENAPSPSKRPRLENGAFDGQNAQRQVSGPQVAMGANGAQQIMPNGQMAGFHPGNPMKMEPTNGMPPGSMPGPGEDEPRHALQDYQMQLMLLEEQNKKRLMQAGTQGTRDAGLAGTPGAFVAPNMSPSGSRGAGPSPGPTEQMKRIQQGTPKLAQQNIAGSPMPDMQNRASPAPNFDPNAAQMAGGMPQNYYQSMANNPMARPPSSHPPNYNMGMAGMTTQQQMETMQRMTANGGRMPNGQGWPPGASPAMQNAQNPALRNGQGPGIMGPPPTPAGEQPATQRAQPSSPAQQPNPPTPSQTKATPKNAKKEAAGNKKKPPSKKGSNAGATPAAESDHGVSQPSTPVTAMHPQFSKSGANSQTTTANAPQASATNSIDPSLPFGVGDDGANTFNLEFANDMTGTDVLENFDFDSFLHTDSDNMGLEFATYDSSSIEAGSGM